MKLYDFIIVKSNPERVWDFLDGPDRMKTWNPKISSVVPLSHGKPRAGYRYRINYLMGSKKRELEAEVKEYRKPSYLLIGLKEQFNVKHNTRYRSFSEAYRLTAHKHGTKVEQTITLNDSGIPFLFQALIKLLMRIGKPKGEKYLYTLKNMVEKELRADV